MEEQVDKQSEEKNGRICVEGIICQLHEEVRYLLQERANVTRRIGILKKTVDSLAFPLGEKSLRQRSDRVGRSK